MNIDRDSIFTNKDVKIYYVNPDDVNTLIQEDYDGNKIVGRMIGDKFVPLNEADFNG